jgi:hypothetical protein
MATRKEKMAQKAADERINRAYKATCHGIQIHMMDISKVFDHGRAAIMAGVDDAELAQRIRAFVETIREN